MDMFNLYRAFLEGIQDIPDIIKYWYLSLTNEDDKTSREMFWWLISWNVDNNYKSVWWMSQDYIRFANKTYSKVEPRYVSPKQLQNYVDWVYSSEEKGYIN